MEILVNCDFWQNRKVAVTGHTGFKGSWLTFWLNKLQSQVHGFAQKPQTNPSLFDELKLKSSVCNRLADIGNFDAVKEWLNLAQPEVIFHLAAQPLVRSSYVNPLLTWRSNLLGTLNLLEAVRIRGLPCAVVIVTTDKVYENRNEQYDYRETDHLGGSDPYSSSKAAVELAVASWRASFFAADTEIRVATARAGNVIGGGDWSEDRIVPDLVRALSENRPIGVRNPNAIRPWQHVLEPLCGYLNLAEKLFLDENTAWQSSFNFGPDSEDCRSVKDLVECSLKHWPGSWKDESSSQALPEAQFLSLSIKKAGKKLGWTPRWNFEKSVEQTITWYMDVMENRRSAIEVCEEQLLNFQTQNPVGDWQLR
jgi:CDP-glucose 4,6-dehydratase